MNFAHFVADQLRDLHRIQVPQLDAAIGRRRSKRSTSNSNANPTCLSWKPCRKARIRRGRGTSDAAESRCSSISRCTRCPSCCRRWAASERKKERIETLSPSGLIVMQCRGVLSSGHWAWTGGEKRVPSRDGMCLCWCSTRGQSRSRPPWRSPSRGNTSPSKLKLDSDAASTRWSFRELRQYERTRQCAYPKSYTVYRFLLCISILHHSWNQFCWSPPCEPPVLRTIFEN